MTYCFTTLILCLITPFSFVLIKYNPAGVPVVFQEVFISAAPNPVVGTANVRYRVSASAIVTIQVTDGNGNLVKTLQNGRLQAGTYNISWNTTGTPAGLYFINTKENGVIKQSIKVVKQ